MSALPIASEIETVVAIAEENPVEAVMAHLDSLETKLNLIAKETLKEAFAEIAALKKALKKAVKAPRAKRTAAKAAGGAAAKGEAPKQVGAWNAFVRDTHELMKTTGWPSFEVTTKKGDTVVYPGGAEEKGTWVVDADEPKKRVVPTYKLAMSYAAYRKTNGEYSDPAAEEREAAKAAKAAEKEEAKKLKAAEREAKKAEKEEKAAAAKAAKATKAEAKPVKAAAKPAAKAAPAAGGAGAKADEKPKASTKVEAKPIAVEDKEDDEDVENPVVWTHGRKKYFKTPTSHMVWEMNGTKPGAWVGVYDPTSNKIDTSAEEPSFEFE